MRDLCWSQARISFLSGSICRRIRTGRLNAEQETWILVIEGHAQIGLLNAFVGEAIFVEADHASLKAGSRGLKGLLAYLGPAPIPGLLQNLDQRNPACQPVRSPDHAIIAGDRRFTRDARKNGDHETDSRETERRNPAKCEPVRRNRCDQCNEWRCDCDSVEPRGVHRQFAPAPLWDRNLHDRSAAGDRSVMPRSWKHPSWR